MSADDILKSWLGCPFCEEEGTVSYWSDNEHITLKCDHCKSKVKLYKGYLTGAPDP